MRSRIEELASVLVDQPAKSPDEVLRRCQAADALAAFGREAAPAVPALLRTLVVRVTVDCALILRVAVAVALWKIDGNLSLALPFLAWALKDEYFGVAPKAVETLDEIGHAAVVPDLIRLAERRLLNGPFHFETFERVSGHAKSRPFLAAIADALGSCAQGRSEGQPYAAAARAMLQRLAACDDEHIRDAAAKALILIKDVREPPT